MDRQPLPTEEDLIARLRRGEVTFPPLGLAWEESPAARVDAVVRVDWQRRTVRFAAECTRLSNPKAVAAAAGQALAKAERAGLRPLVIVPFLGEPALDALEARAVSGIDLCGNGVVTVPGEWYVRRTGGPNRFRPEGVIKNVYRGGSSGVARLFLARPEFASVQDALNELLRRGGRVTLPTVSKVCKSLENDLIVERMRSGATKLRLIQPDKLLDKLAANYVPPAVARRVSGKPGGVGPAEFRARLREWAEQTGNRVTLTGASSVAAYAVMARDGAEEFYCTDAAGAVRALGDRFQVTERFATVGLLEVRNDEVYLDRREDLTASPVQTFLELSAGDKRDRETAEQVRRVILAAAALPAGR